MSNFPAVLNVASLTADEGYVRRGSAGQLLGTDLSVGDLNHDGFADLIVGAPGANAAYVIFGGADGIPDDFDPASLDGTNGFAITRPTSASMGTSARFIGDVNADGIDDILVGAPTAGFDFNGAIYVIYGRAGAYGASFSVGALDAATGFSRNGLSRNLMGTSADAIGDFNGDGVGDFAAGGPGTPARTGAALILYGGSGALSGFWVEVLGVNDQFGGHVRGIGDVNHDGIDDIAIGGAGVNSDDGMVAVIYGSTTPFPGNFNTASINGSNGFRINGLANDGLAPVGGIGDINSDGIDDFAVAAPNADFAGISSGAVYVIFGQTGLAAPDIYALDGVNGFLLTGAGAGDQLGAQISHGDVNHDGIDDLLVTSAVLGSVYVVYGHAGPFAANLSVTSLDGVNGFEISGVGGQGGRSGLVVADLNGDGVDDIAIGAPSDSVSAANAGAVHVIYGRVGDRVLTGSASADVLEGAAGADTLSGLDDKDLLYGRGGDDSLDGGAGHDLLDGGTGADLMAGGLGDDSYIVDDAGDLLTEFGGEGSDRVRATVSFTLGDNLENLTLEGVGDIDGTGNGLNNVIDGNSGANTLAAGAGADLVKGWGGDDVLHGGTGADHLLGGDGADDLDGADDNDRLDGGANNDTLDGGAGNDILDGGADNDSLTGGTGADQLLGGAGTDTLDGGAENDSLNGGLGADAMTGGTGDDVFFVDDAGDATIELSGEGADQVRSTISHTLADNIEILVLQGGSDLDGTGNGLANTLNGNNGSNVLDGAGGNDILKGGLGADTLIGGTGADILVGGAGADSFVVRQESVHSSLVPAGRFLEVDTISDFSTADGDIVDLSAIDAVAGGGDDAFTLVGAFSSQAGQMTLTFAAGTTTLRLDTDGDGQADYMMKINGDVTGASGGWLL